MLYLKNLNSILSLTIHCKYYMCGDNPKIDPSSNRMTDYPAKCLENESQYMLNKDTTAERGDVNNFNTDDVGCKDSETYEAGKEAENSGLNRNEDLLKIKFDELFNKVCGSVEFDSKDLNKIDNDKEFYEFRELISQEKKDLLVDTKLFERFLEMSEMAYKIIHTISKQRGQKFQKEANVLKNCLLLSSTHLDIQINDRISAFTTDNTNLELNKLVSTVKLCKSASLSFGKANFYYVFYRLNALIRRYTNDATVDDQKDGLTDY